MARRWRSPTRSRLDIEHPRRRRWLRHAAVALAAGAGYFAFAWLATRYTSRVGDVACVWPAGGFMLGLLLTVPAARLPSVLAAGFTADLLHARMVTGSLRVSLEYASGYFACLALAALLLRRWMGAPVRLDTIRGVLLFVLVAPLAANAVAAALGATVTGAAAHGRFEDTFKVWWLSDALGIALVTPFVIAWADAGALDWRRMPGPRLVEAAAIGLGVLVTAHLAFSARPEPSGAVIPLTHLVVPFLLWALLRFEARGGTAAVALLAVVALFHTLHGRGPFSAALPGSEALLQLQGYLAVIAAMALLGIALVAERARLDRRLRDAEKMEVLGLMASGIAHDFNNLLGAIGGYAEMAGDAAQAGGKLRRQLDAIAHAVQRGKNLVGRILPLTRQAPLDPRPVVLRDVLIEARDMLEALAPGNVTVRLQLHDPDAVVAGDATQLHQLALNLGTNALHAMPRGGLLDLRLATRTLGRRVRLSHGRLRRGRYAVVQVADTGAGIVPEVLANMFEPFYTTRPAGRGSGLGLAIVRAVVAAHGGAIDMRTRLDAGTTFSVFLPVIAAAPLPAAPAATAVAGGGRTVLVVDDDPLVLPMVEEMLAGLGYEPVGYAAPDRALEAFRADPARFDAALLDQRMPGMTGTELAGALRAVRADLPVILSTGFHADDLSDRARRAGVAEIIAKPYAAGELGAALARVTERGNSA
jgi:signal transduction histidine kinase/CheY-like chemotaxis protein